MRPSTRAPTPIQNTVPTPRMESPTYSGRAMSIALTTNATIMSRAPSAGRTPATMKDRGPRRRSGAK